jgi:hypothetical protein
MTQLSAVSSLQIVKTSGGSKDNPNSSAPHSGSSDTPKGAPNPDDGPAVINEVQDIQKKFTSQEIATIQTAILSVDSRSSPTQLADSLNGALAQIAAIRDHGENAYIITSAFKAASATMTILSGSQITVAMGSADPAAMGSALGTDGKTYYVKDMIDMLIGLDDAADAQTALADGMSKILQAASNGSEPAWRLKNDHGALSIFIFQAVPKVLKVTSYGAPGRWQGWSSRPLPAEPTEDRGWVIQEGPDNTDMLQIIPIRCYEFSALSMKNDGFR